MDGPWPNGWIDGWKNASWMERRTDGQMYLWRHAAPVVGVQGAGFQHGAGQGQVLGNEQVEHTRVCQEVVAVYKLHSRHTHGIDSGNIK